MGRGCLQDNPPLPHPQQHLQRSSVMRGGAAAGSGLDVWVHFRGLSSDPRNMPPRESCIRHRLAAHIFQQTIMLQDRVVQTWDGEQDGLCSLTPRLQDQKCPEHSNRGRAPAAWNTLVSESEEMRTLGRTSGETPGPGRRDERREPGTVQCHPHKASYESVARVQQSPCRQEGRDLRFQS